MGVSRAARHGKVSGMLEITEGAVEVIKAIVEDGQGGLRLDPQPGEGEDTEFDLEVVDGPADGDETVERDGARVYLPASASDMLSDKVLDAHEHDDHVHFMIGQQGEELPSHDH
jgi:iron-sulfur cluster assembly protein